MNIIPVDTGSEKARAVITVFFDNSMVFSLKEHCCSVKRENLCGHDLWVMLKVCAVKMKVTPKKQFGFRALILKYCTLPLSLRECIIMASEPSQILHSATESERMYNYGFRAFSNTALCH